MDIQVQLERLLNHMLTQGFRITSQRKAILDLILRFNRPFTAIELYHIMEKTFHGMSYGTVYRNLKILSQMRIVETFAMDNEIRYRVIKREPAPFQFMCIDCKKTIAVDFNPTQIVLPMPNRVYTVNYPLDILGYCTDCTIPTQDSLPSSI